MADQTSSQSPRISDAEWTVMRAFWKLGEGTLAEVVSSLEGKTDWNPKTIQTLVGRLVKKGFLTFEKQGREHRYRPAMDEATIKTEASQSFLDRVFEGRLTPFFANFVENADCSAEELAELKRILEEKTDGNDR